MANEKVVESFNKSVKQLTLAIDLRIEAKDYGHASTMVDDMESILKRIVSTMFLHNSITKCESDLFMVFINRIVMDKRTIIHNSEKIRRLEFESDYNLFFEKVKNKWEEYIAPSHHEEGTNQGSTEDSNYGNYQWEPNDGEEDL